jgi:hypothetical protein
MFSNNAALAGQRRSLYATGRNRRASRQPDGVLYRFGGRIDAATPDLSHALVGTAMIALFEGCS